MHSRPGRSFPILFLFLGVLLALPATLEARSFYGTITAVESATRFVVSHEAGTVAVRLYGVDAPEGAQPFAFQARVLADTLVGGQFCRIRVKGRAEDGTWIAQVLRDGRDLGVALLDAGLAKRQPDAHYKIPAKGQADALVASENQARLAGLGIWSLATAARATDSAAADAPFVTSALLVAGTTDINTSQKGGDDNECAVAKSPANPDQLFMSCNTSSAGLFAVRSTDGGATWVYPDATDKTIADGDAGQGTAACCDPTMAWDSFGNLYVTYISNTLNQIVTLLSTDGGATYAPLATFTGSVDQPTVVAADTTSGVAVWIIWNQSGSMVARGATATALGTVGAFSTLQSVPGSSSCSFGDIAIAPNGAVVQVCGQPVPTEGPANLQVSIDADGFGAGGWSALSTASATNVGGFDVIPPQAQRTVDAEAGFAFDTLSTSPRFGRLYMVYTDEVVDENNDTNILVRFSDNNGTTWSAPIRVNDDTTTRSQFLPKISSDPTTGIITVCWHDSRNSGTNTAMELFCSWASPEDATPVFSPNTLVSDGSSTSNGSGVEFGDYMGLAMGAGVAHPVWADTSNSTANNPNGTSAFDGYTDGIAFLFGDGFETGSTARWDIVVP